jgi:potassium-transporting ATPase KdpC subunit
MYLSVVSGQLSVVHDPFFEVCPMLKEFVPALRMCGVTFALCAVVYPAVVWGLAQLLFPAQADGSLIYSADGRTVIGSELVAQPFGSPGYFHPRPSAIDFKADAAGGSNLGTNNPELRKAVALRAQALGAALNRPAPVDLVTASGSGLDPDISTEAAYFQAERVASARGLSLERVRAMIETMTNRSGAIIGAPARVNVLLLNLELDKYIVSISS